MALRAQGGIAGFVLTAVLLTISFPLWNLTYCAWCAFIPFFWALTHATRLKAFLFSYVTGVMFWLGTVYWVAHVTAAGMLILVCYLGLYFAFFGLIVSFVLRNGKFSCLFLIPGLWVVLEYVRSHLFSGFPWALLAYTQYKNIPLIQVADITGAWGISFIIMVSNVALFLLFERGVTAAKKSKILFSLLVLLCVVYMYGFRKIDACRKPTGTRKQGITITLIQGNIPQELKWDENSEMFILNKYFRLTNEAAKDRPDLLIWPEAAVPFILGEEPAHLKRLEEYVHGLHIPVLLGAVTIRNNSYYNSALLMQSDGSVRGQYDKLHLVPFGEYVPLRELFPFLETFVPIGDFHKGDTYTVFRMLPKGWTDPVTFSVLICFEDLFPGLSREFVKHNAAFLVNITNDGWFQKTSAPYQHLQASVFRAVENRVYVLRAANTGISGFINACGEVFSLVHDTKGEPTFVDGFDKKTFFPIGRTATFYTRHGDFLVSICAGLVILGVFIYSHKRGL